MYNLALFVIEMFGSKELSRQCSKILLVDQHRKSQLPYMATVFFKQHGDSQILNAQSWLEENIEMITQQIGYEDSRTFRRLFKQNTSLSPREYRSKFRVD